MSEAEQIEKLQKQIDILGNALVAVISFQEQKYSCTTLEHNFYSDISWKLEEALRQLENSND